MSVAKRVGLRKKQALELNELIVDSIQDIKGKQIVLLDLKKLDESPADYFIICQGESVTQVRAIANNVERRVKAEHLLAPNHVEGMEGSRWILIDYFDTIVHVFYPETREYYDIESLWNDAHKIEYQDI